MVLVDNGVMLISLIGMSMPGFWLGLCYSCCLPSVYHCRQAVLRVLKYYFTNRLQRFDPYGYCHTQTFQYA